MFDSQPQIPDVQGEEEEEETNEWIGKRDPVEVRKELNDLNDKIRTLNRSKKAAEDDLKRPEKSDIFDDLKEDIEIYDKKVLELRE